MSEEMIEKVARAITGADGTDPNKIGGFTGEPYWRLYVDEARAAIAAYNPNERLREALEAIIVADTKTESTAHLSYADDREVWTHRRVDGKCAKIARSALSPLPQESNL